MSACSVSLDGSGDSPQKPPEARAGDSGYSAPSTSVDPGGQPTYVDVDPDGGTLTHDAASITYSGPEGNFSINTDRSIAVSFPDGTTCTSDPAGGLVARSGTSGMRCSVYVYSTDGEIVLTVKDSAGNDMWTFGTVCDDGHPPSVRRYLPNGSSEDFA
ncbi:MAG: hypothetical protein FWF02_11555 [Micrococcales bacterium]|nr:hypothetical protein [Micrococcales bacterium]MCL2668322.1 hypothetical protein [Micrococcales bacterium]